MSFLMLEKSSNKIKDVYLFGSSVRDELDKESDIDIFINCNRIHENETLKSAKIAERKFRLSKDFEKWKLLEFAYPFSIKAGMIGEWELKTSIMAEGLVLFSRNAAESRQERFVIFIIVLPKKRPAYLSLARELFGRKEKEFIAKGLVEARNGTRLGSNIFMAPKASQTEFISLLHKRKIDFRMIEISQQL